MPLGVNRHVDDGRLEKYSMGTLPETEVSELEEHLLVCEPCQTQLEEMDGYIRAIRSASAKLRAESKWGWLERWRIASHPVLGSNPVWASAFAVLFLVLLVGGRGRLPDGQPVAVLLASDRAVASSTAPAGKPLLLKVDLSQLSGSPAYRLDIVDSVGTSVWGAPAKPEDGQISLQVTKRLSPGFYYVRLYAQSQELLREFTLHLK